MSETFGQRVAAALRTTTQAYAASDQVIRNSAKKKAE